MVEPVGRTWRIAPLPPGGSPETKRVRISALGSDVEVICPEALEGTEFTVVGSISATRGKFTGDRYAVADFSGALGAAADGSGAASGLPDGGGPGPLEQAGGEGDDSPEQAAGATGGSAAPADGARGTAAEQAEEPRAVAKNVRADILQQVKFSKLVGYLPTNRAGFYVAVRKPRRALAALLAILVAAVLAAGICAALTVFLHVETPFTPVLDANQSEYTGNPYVPSGEAPRNTHEVPGLTRITVSADSPTVQLGNPSGNQCLFKYTVTAEGGDVIYEANWIEPGRATLWNAWEAFGGVPGEYTVQILIEAANAGTGSALNSVEQTCRVTLQV